MNKNNRNNNSSSSIHRMLHRIEDSISSSTFDPQALLNLLDRRNDTGGVEDDNSCRWGDSNSLCNGDNDMDNDIDNDIDNSARSDDLHLHHRRSFAQRGSNPFDVMPVNNRRMSASSAQSVASFTTNMSQRQASTLTMVTHINHHATRSNPFTKAASSVASASANGSSVVSSSVASSAFSITSSVSSAIKNTHWKRRTSDDGFVCGPGDLNNRYGWQLLTTKSRQRTLLLVATTALLLLVGFYNYSLGMFLYSTNSESDMITQNQQGGLFSSYINNNSSTTNSNNNNENIPFVMCDRITPYQHSSNNVIDRSQYQQIVKPYTFLSTNGQWPKSNKILLLRNDGKFGHIGNQFNSLLHAFDYARDHNLHIGMLFHSWAMDVIHTMFYESVDFDILTVDMEVDFGILLVRNQSQLLLYDEVISKNAEQLYFYKSSNKNVDSWRDTMSMHKSILQQLFHRYNRGYGYVHNGLRAKDVCATIDMFFKDRLSTIKYSVIHAQWMDGNAIWKLEQIAKTTGITIEGGAGTMSPAYVKAILKPLGMLEHPIILLSDGQLPGIERALLNDAIIGPRLMVLSDRVALDGGDITLAVLSDVFIGNPASVTSGFIARVRMTLGYSDASTQLFRRKRIHQWYSVCNEDCVFNPWILGKWV